MSKFIEKYSVPVAIIVAGLFVAGAVVLTNFYTKPLDSEGQLAQVNEPLLGEEANNLEPFKNVKLLSDNDHFLGNKDAKIKIVTFSDFQCPYCIRFEENMRQAVSDYSNDVAWVFRHFPLDSHEYAMPAAIASECIAELKGEDYFWKFMEKFSSESLSGEQISINSIVLSLGVNESDFNDCYDSGRYLQKVSDNFADGIESGLQGTPYSVVFVDGSPVDIINGAQSLAWIKDVISQYLE
ncbi:MAG: thioredoxin domain-containing protein [Candidatus Colwellbacteria bacterium]|jgi:protein-disulfide isomerase|nr:DsbA family protein [Candidatus Colwellbacteria bacterium]MCK9497478.1 DsbA family protein [Candidatus Colwellbacteria bacterium]MDD3752476.1 thioredoxin domain-containing protein [Candidatus Colwellbacteria bacterium]MDD4818734.1 thioredoxin domain-containing protein [Candidatus Colwellbacteria bacterium]